LDCQKEKKGSRREANREIGEKDLLKTQLRKRKLLVV